MVIFRLPGWRCRGFRSPSTIRTSRTSSEPISRTFLQKKQQQENLQNLPYVLDQDLQQSHQHSPAQHGATRSHWLSSTGEMGEMGEIGETSPVEEQCRNLQWRSGIRTFISA